MGGPEWYCRWKVYDDAGSCVLTKSGFICARKAMNYRQAVAHFSALSKDDRLLRPLGLRPLGHSTIQKAVHRIGVRVGIKINPYSFRERLLSRLERLLGGLLYQSRRDLLDANLEADESGHHRQAARSELLPEDRSNSRLP